MSGDMRSGSMADVFGPTFTPMTREHDRIFREEMRQAREAREAAYGRSDVRALGLERLAQAREDRDAVAWAERNADMLERRLADRDPRRDPRRDRGSRDPGRVRSR